MEIVTFSEASSQLESVLDRVADDADYTIVKRPNAKDAVIMSVEYFNSLVETTYLLSSPANAEHLKRSIAQHQAKEVTERELIED
ncbi:MAG: type II toxin-antitoxin system prevent-host-death family antitoxin [Cyanobacteria bacterium J06634_6]